MPKPLILIDFDGVFNIINSVASARKQWGKVITATIPYEGDTRQSAFSVIVAQDVIDFFVWLDSLGVVDIRWLSTWTHNTSKFPQFLGLPEFGWLERPDHDPEWGWWKLDVAKEVIGEDKEVPVLWIDDDHSFDPGARKWLREHPNVTAIAPKTVLGLTLSDLKEVIIFIEKETGYVYSPNS
jgi:hypothetical protein